MSQNFSEASIDFDVPKKRKTNVSSEEKTKDATRQPRQIRNTKIEEKSQVKNTEDQQSRDQFSPDQLSQDQHSQDLSEYGVCEIFDEQQARDGKSRPNHLIERGRDRPIIPSSLVGENARDDLQVPLGNITTSFPQRNAGIFNNMATNGLLEKIKTLEENQKYLARAVTNSEAAHLKTQQIYKVLQEGLARLDGQAADHTVALDNIRYEIEELKTAVQSFKEVIREPSSSKNVGMESLPTTSTMKAAGLYSVAVNETPKEFCHVDFQGRRHALCLTETEEALIRGATTQIEVVRRILLKHYTPVKLQEMTLKGNGRKGGDRSEFPGWLVELTQEAVKTLNPIGDPQPGEDSNIAKLREAALRNQRKEVRRNISYICQYNRETRDSEGNRKKRQRTSKTRSGMPADGDSNEHDQRDNEEGSAKETSL